MEWKSYAKLIVYKKFCFIDGGQDKVYQGFSFICWLFSVLSFSTISLHKIVSV